MHYYGNCVGFWKRRETRKIGIVYLLLGFIKWFGENIKTMAERSNYQNKVIRNYYDNRESISLQRCEELVTELYLAAGKKRERHWKSLATHLGNLGVAEATIQHLRDQNKPETVAHFIANLAKKR